MADFKWIHLKEWAEIRARREELLSRKTPELKSTGSVEEVGRTAGLSLSGGGIRSACFSLGLLEGLDRIACKPTDATNGTPSDEKRGVQEPSGSAATGIEPDAGCCLEYFDYVSSVSGGSYAAGYFAMTMVPPGPSAPDRAGENAAAQAPRGRSSDRPTAAWLGKADLSSKTVPGWLWGLGAWFLGVVHQLLKTGSLLVCALAFIAFVLRMLDAPSASRFWYVVGLRSDVTRGFVPFWIALGMYLTAYGFHMSKLLRKRIGLWFWYTRILIAIYIWFAWMYDERAAAEGRPALPFLFQYSTLLALVAPIILFSMWILGLDLLRWFKLKALEFSGRKAAQPASNGNSGDHTAAPGSLRAPQSASTESRAEDDPEVLLRDSLLLPVLVALFCFAGLVTTGDIGLTSYGEGDSPDEFRQLLEKGEWYGRIGDKLYQLAIWTLGIISAVFLFPRKLFQSVREIEARSTNADDSGLRRWALGPVFRVIVFLCSYGFVLLVVFVVYSTVARENVSGYFEWRDYLRSAALHPAEFRSWARAWDQIAKDAADPSASPWGPLAAELMAARDAAAEPTEEAKEFGEIKGNPDNWKRLAPAFPLANEKAEAAEIRLLDSMPWIVRLAPPLMYFGPEKPWNSNGLTTSWRLSRLYDLLAHNDRLQLDVAAAISNQVLGRPDLYRMLKDVEEPVLADIDLQSEVDAQASQKSAPEAHRIDAGRLEAVLTRAEPGEGPTRGAAVPGGDRGTLRFYLDVDQKNTAKAQVPNGWKAALGSYRANAERLEAVMKRAEPEERPALEAAVADNNREALRLYLPRLFRERHGPSKQIFAWIVWQEDQWTRLRIFFIALGLWILCCSIDANVFSLHRFYRRHVIESWVSHSPGQPPDEGCHWLDGGGRSYRGYDYDQKLPATIKRVPRRAPLLLFNTTLEGNRSLGHEPLMNQHIFTFSPVGSGSGETAYWPNGGDASFIRRNNLDVANMVATSGAFLSPGTIANPALFAILHLLNIQTGYWVHDPAKFDVRSPWEGFWFQVFQSVGIDRGGDSRHLLTDGAHVENLGLYALLQRRCSLIVASDCSQGDSDKHPEHRFDALVQVLQQAGVDGIEFGPFLNSYGYLHWLHEQRIAPRRDREACDRAAPTGLNLLVAAERSTAASSAAVGDPAAGNGACEKALACGMIPGSRARRDARPAEDAGGPPRRFAQEHHLFCWFRYPEGGEGLLVYLRPTITGDEGDGLLHAAVGSRFPEDDPLDQFYTPAKMNTYRLLGRHTATMLMNDPVMRAAFGEFLRGEPNVIGDAANAPPACDCHVASCDWRRPWLSSKPTVSKRNSAPQEGKA
jgi:hypothetical protein